MTLSVLSGPKLPPAYKRTPETFKGTVFAIGEAQATKYIPGNTGAPIPDCWDDGNPKMQVVIYIVGQSGKAMRLFVGKSQKVGSQWLAWTNALAQLKSTDFDDAIGKTFLFNCKTSYKPDGSVGFSEWTITPAIGEDYRLVMEEEWKSLPQGMLPPFYYPGYGPVAQAPMPAPAPAAVTVAPVMAAAEAAAATSPLTAAAAVVAAPTMTPAEATNIYQDDIPF